MSIKEVVFLKVRL